LLRVLHRDDRLVVVDKPSGLAVHPGWSGDEVTALHRVRDAIGQWVYPVHRLDRGTSGALLFALDPEAARVLCDAFEGGRIDKRYLALVRGVTPEALAIDHPIPRKEGGPRVPALTEFVRVWHGNHVSLVEARPRTGRLHQIRRHMKHISHPLIGDANYGKGALNREYRERFGLMRLALHASRLSFPHPVSGEPIVVEAGLPEDLRVPFERIGVAF